MDETTNVKCKCKYNCNTTGGGIYGLAFIGALVYYIQNEGGSFQMVLLAILKAIIWPALLIYKLLGL